MLINYDEGGTEIVRRIELMTESVINDERDGKILNSVFFI